MQTFGNTLDQMWEEETRATEGLAEDAMAGFIPSRRLLVIDDDPMVRKTLAQLLRNAGHRVEEADDGSAGLAVLNKMPVDLVLTDLGMPGLSGWEVARAVKAGHPYLPVVLVTGWAGAIAMEHQGRAFVDAILPKPSRFQEIQTVIGHLTGEAAGAASNCGIL